MRGLLSLHDGVLLSNQVHHFPFPNFLFRCTIQKFSVNIYQIVMLLSYCCCRLHVKLACTETWCKQRVQAIASHVQRTRSTTDSVWRRADHAVAARCRASVLPRVRVSGNNGHSKYRTVRVCARTVLCSMMTST